LPTGKIQTAGGATNENGFTALPGGNRNPSGAFGSIGDNGVLVELYREYHHQSASVWYWYMNFDNAKCTQGLRQQVCTGALSAV